MDFRILGSVEVLSGGQPLPVGGPKQRALLAYLLLNNREAVSAERLIDELWYDPPAGGVGAVQTQVSRLRRALGGRITTSGNGYSIDLEPGELDLDRFRSLLAEAGTASSAVERSRLLVEADALWRGRPLQGVDGPFVAAEVRALDELRLAAVEERLEADLDAGRAAALVSELSSLVAHHPLRERLRSHLILALYRTGRQAEALVAFRETRQMLDDDLGLEPSLALRDLERAILRHDPALTRVSPGGRDPVIGPTRPRRRRRRSAVVAAAAVVAVAALVAAVATLANEEGSTPALTTASHGATAPQAVALKRSLGVRHAREHHVTSRPHRPTRRLAPTRSATAPASVQPTKYQPTPGTGGQVSVTTLPTASRDVPTTTAQTATTAGPPPTRRKTTSHTKIITTIPAPTPPPKPVTLSDTFDGDFIDPTIWHQVTTDANVSVAEQDGQLLVTVGAAAVRGGDYNQIDVHVGTQCTFPGDFDAHVDFTLLEWPQADNIFVGLNAIYASAAVGREYNSAWGDEYASWVVPGTNGSIPLTDTSGSLRIARVNGIATSYIWHRGAWARIARGNSTGAAVFGLQAMSSDAASSFGQQELKVAFDNFTVTGVTPICPPGSEPPGS